MKVAVIDGNSIMNRAFYGIRLLSTKDGLYTNAVLGFINILLKLRDDESPDGICVCFDLKAPTFRHKRYDGYKAGRKPMPEELVVQMPVVKELLDAMGIRRLELEGYEADDLLGTIASTVKASGGKTVIVTGDRDSLQLADECTTIRIMASKGGQTESRIYDPMKINLDYGVAPAQLIDVKALMGDTSDNIPGVHGVGEKTALALIAQYGSLDALYNDLESADLKPALKEKLAAGKELAYMSRELAEIDCHVPADVHFAEMTPVVPDSNALYNMLSKLEFKSVIARLGLKPAAPVLNTCAYETPEILSQPPAAIPEGKTAFCADSGMHVMAVTDGKQAWTLYDQAILDYICAPGGKIGFHVKAAAKYALDAGREPSAFAGDMMLAGYLLNNGTDLKGIAGAHGFAAPEPVYENKDAFAPLADTKEAERALCEAALLVFRLEEPMEAELQKQEMTSLYHDIELPLSTVIARMEHAGFHLDRQQLMRFGETLSENMKTLQAQIFGYAGREFNLNSPKQMGEVLFEGLGLKGGRKTKTGYSTDIDTLNRLKNIHPIIGAIIDYRQLSKLKTTYVDGLSKVVSPVDDRVYSTFHQTGTATGRLSSTEPNMQNIPVRRELGGEIRRCFTAPEGFVLVDADYSQIELRVLAHIAGDEKMKAAFQNGEDIHTITASQVFGVSPDLVTTVMRNRAKAVNFGIVYGISDFSLAEDIKVSRKEAREYIDRYFEKYSGVRRYMDEIIQFTRTNGYVTTLYGRRRPIPDINASNFNLRSSAERIALNTPIQGTAADIIKIAMVRVSERLQKEFPRARLILQVHDELIVEAPKEQGDQIKEALIKEMTDAASLSVVLTVEGGAGENWLEVKG